MSFLDKIKLNQSEIIIGVFDNGIFHKSLSFADFGYGPPPSRWRYCGYNLRFSSNKLLAVKVYTNPQDSHTDGNVGHGTQCTGIAAGKSLHVKYHNAMCKVRGLLLQARIAFYKVNSSINPFWSLYVNWLEVLMQAAFDGVHVISISISAVPQSAETSNTKHQSENHRGSKRLKLTDRLDEFDRIEKPSISVITKYNTLVCAAGGKVMSRRGVRNKAPWMLTVGASTSRNKFTTRIILRNMEKNAYEPFELDGLNLKSTNGFCRLFYYETFRRRVDGPRGNIVVFGCHRIAKQVAEQAEAQGISGIIILTSEKKDAYEPIHNLPTAYIFDKIQKAKLTTYMRIYPTNGQAKILCSREVENPDFPTLFQNSARGPCWNSDFFLKPDICVPGVQILTPSPKHEFTLFTGTSASTPMVAGIAATIKFLHPDWSPTEIKSAIMTTATPMNVCNDNSEILLARYLCLWGVAVYPVD